ncbi:hypothetical protein [Sphingomonas sp. OTU376]|uniref:hypothetical protein n=1 Tax=Sphingomonas sp. OTU376 TaxID=3043863 RepID=UPI00313C69A5
MKLYILAALATIASTGAIAQDRQSSPHNPAVKDSRVHAVARPARGHSSFTQSQARGRIAKAGFTKISGLRKNNDGVWQGRAMKHRRPVTVMLDFKGNVTSR